MYGQLLKQIPAPEDVFLCVETTGPNNSYGSYTACYRDTAANPTYALGVVITVLPFHTGGWNYLFCDGHAMWYRPEWTVGTGILTNPKGLWTKAKGD